MDMRDEEQERVPVGSLTELVTNGVLVDTPNIYGSDFMDPV